MAKRQIQVGPQLIYHMIEGQAGTFGKALLEFVMNSIDAGAGSVNITLTPKSFSVADDGKGVNRIEEVEECLATLGFDHGDNNERTYGKFGIGRSQAWAFAPTRMRTGSFQMDVDIRNWGLEYELKNDLSEQEGFVVSGNFYEPMSPSDVDRTERELAELAAYAQIPVVLNGKSIAKLPQEQKWDIETDQCYIKLQERGQLAVYNLGVLVRTYPAHHFGTGGVVVSKTPLQVNFARNDVLEAKCKVWKEVREFIRKQAGEKTRRKPSLNDSQREFLIQQRLHGEISLIEVEKVRLIKDITGKAHPLTRLMGQNVITFCSERDKRLATRVHEKKLAFVLHPSMLDFLGARTPDEVSEKLWLLLSRETGGSRFSHYRGDVFSFEDFRDAFTEGHDIIEQKDLNKLEKAAVAAMNKACQQVPGYFRSAIGENVSRRKIVLGVSETAEAWTDGQTYVAVDKETAKLLRKGIEGTVRLAGILIHEFCHDSADLSGHGHPPEFYEKFHEVMLSDGYFNGAGGLAHDLLRFYTAELKRAGLKPTQAMLKAADDDFTTSNTEDANAA